MKKLILLFALLTLSSGLFAVGSPTQDEALENQVRMLADQLRCPTCQSMSVKDSEAGLSNNMKAMIREMLLQGKSESEIMDFFVARYGEWILREPPKSGFNLLLWFLPGGILVFAFAWVILRAKSKAKASVHAYTEVALSPEEQAEIDEDLKKISNP
ncbi:MAG: hypothetical protein A2600_10260 [Candidatus Lambdaproteobacteria bacterium RIFOXYD1_FULL_56_27]|uniref:Cytochrome c-type biogenesis protein n=1 Tax=Candidatus Lambdaproteobacteria bacterium RIFOXYD2_FULL_56_26 TaxID=1817773 RepID=A0A1F6GQH6_9PROT|nr:MAG: hypothetical protein A2557_09425 [Candidatus Lambdaproteobacteria bacterium RIFOXYD2_FULL_56_26]OGH04150.1 MAG: hypothetical protein A2426_02815 [Candidatus Lambdaproteobacteria bacterium RIFOXYC1_FULL_56_13]OGH06333.1 MAG: hypothetical protein A2600_10260 [Candidatus Lambdaproteobacteria bacterium RIFOXYD1_FULL_56_27]